MRYLKGIFSKDEEKNESRAATPKPTQAAQITQVAKAGQGTRSGSAGSTRPQSGVVGSVSRAEQGEGQRQPSRARATESAQEAQKHVQFRRTIEYFNDSMTPIEGTGSSQIFDSAVKSFMTSGEGATLTPRPKPRPRPRGLKATLGTPEPSGLASLEQEGFSKKATIERRASREYADVKADTDAAAVATAATATAKVAPIPKKRTLKSAKSSLGDTKESKEERIARILATPLRSSLPMPSIERSIERSSLRSGRPTKPRPLPMPRKGLKRDQNLLGQTSRQTLGEQTLNQTSLSTLGSTSGSTLERRGSQRSRTAAAKKAKGATKKGQTRGSDSLRRSATLEKSFGRSLRSSMGSSMGNSLGGSFGSGLGSGQKWSKGLMTLKPDELKLGGKEGIRFTPRREIRTLKPMSKEEIEIKNKALTEDMRQAERISSWIGRLEELGGERLQELIESKKHNENPLAGALQGYFLAEHYQKMAQKGKTKENDPKAFRGKNEKRIRKMKDAIEDAIVKELKMVKSLSREKFGLLLYTGNVAIIDAGFQKVQKANQKLIANEKEARALANISSDKAFKEAMLWGVSSDFVDSNTIRLELSQGETGGDRTLLDSINRRGEEKMSDIPLGLTFKEQEGGGSKAKSGISSDARRRYRQRKAALSQSGRSNVSR